MPNFESRFRGTHLSQSQGPAQTEVSNGSCQTVRVAGLCAADMCAASQQRTTGKLSDTQPSCRSTRVQCEASANISRYIMQQGYLHQHRLGRLPARLAGSVHRPPLPDLSSTFSHLRSPWHTWRSACSCRYTSPAATSAQRRSSIDCSAATQFAQADFQTLLLRPHAIHFQTRLSDKAAHFGFGSDRLFVVSPVVQHATQLLSSTGLLDTVCDQPKDPSSKVMVRDSSPR
jgi:hypothetical protein